MLLGVRKFEERRLGGLTVMDVEIDFAPDGGKTQVRIERVLVDYERGSVAANWTPPEGPRQRLSLQMRLPRHHLHELLGEIAEIPQVLGIQQGDRRETKRS